MPIFIGCELWAVGMGYRLPVAGPRPGLPDLSNFRRKLFGRPGGIQHEHIPGELMAKPGLLALGILPGSDGDRLRHRVSGSSAMQVFDGFTYTDAVETRRMSSMP